jgi:Secretion system C-terminal sorting domain
MKKIILLLFLSNLTNFVFAQLIWSYDFKTDTVGKTILNKNGWSGKTDKGYPGGGECAGASCEPYLVKSDTLEYPNYGSFYKALDIHRNAEGLGHFFTSTNKLPDTTYKPTYKDGDKVYVSYLLKVKTAPLGNDAQPSLGQVIRINGGSFSVGMRLTITKSSDAATQFRFGVEKNGSARFSDFKYAFDQTHLIVMRYTYKDSLNANDEVALFINPKMTAGEPTPDFVTTTGTDYTLNSFLIYGNNFTQMATGSLTGIKAYQKWNDVVSATTEIRNESLSIRPTLAENFIELNVDKAYPSVSNITVVDLQGREVLADKLNRDETRKILNINGLAKGFYVVSIQNIDFIATQKFVKN